jgi:hypothetical protein
MTTRDFILLMWEIGYRQSEYNSTQLVLFRTMPASHKVEPNSVIESYIKNICDKVHMAPLDKFGA